jgi:hypothetical protein
LSAGAYRKIDSPVFLSPSTENQENIRYQWRFSSYVLVAVAATMYSIEIFTDFEKILNPTV